MCFNECFTKSYEHLPTSEIKNARAKQQGEKMTKVLQRLKMATLKGAIWSKIGLWGQFFQKNEFSQICPYHPAMRTNGFYKLYEYQKKLSTVSNHPQKTPYPLVQSSYRIMGSVFHQIDKSIFFKTFVTEGRFLIYDKSYMTASWLACRTVTF